MVAILPFQGTHYNPNKIQDLSRVIAPPYDLINSNEQENYYTRNQWNVIRLILGKKYPTDDEENNRYSRAVSFLKEWKDQEVLIRDERPGIYFWAQTYKIWNRVGCRIGIITTLKLEELGKGVYPHEKTFQEPKTDRLKLIRACRTNFSSIMGIYTDPEQTINKLFEREIMNRPPLMDVTDDSGLQNKIWGIYEPELIENIQALFQDKSILIADGHHRYESSLKYRDEARKNGNPADYVMIYLTNSASHGFEILPLHRIVKNCPDSSVESFLKDSEKYFQIEHIPNPNFETGPILNSLGLGKRNPGKVSSIQFGMMTEKGDYYLLTLTSQDVLKQDLFNGIPELLRNMDVVVFHKLILNNLLKIKSQDQTEKGHILYMADEEKMVELLKNKEAKLGFFLRPVPYPTVDQIAQYGERLPQKTTYFFPKLTSGLIMNEF